ncbi:hypothetical protein BGP75_19710 [Motiliproteus sp. MSK22-1]|nr:hypothetical protein BGP75_19710 [Motiliproteus sp. MSK22-1]
MSEGVPRQRILIVDDSITTIRLLADLLSDMAEVFFVTDGREALSKAEEVSPALILLDVEMPEISGYEVGRMLKQNPVTANIPFLFITARSDGEDEEKGLRLGAVDYISKPILPAVVCARVQLQLKLQYMTEQLRKANANLQQLANRDSLTDVFNRRRFMELANSSYALSRRSSTPLSLIMLDVDHFKQINDSYGHDSGDITLIELVAVCNDVLREVDVLGRIGGEEFAILLPDTEQHGAYSVAERLRKKIADISISYEDQQFGITVSMGIAELGEEGDTVHHLMKRADDALYQAKREGRNSVSVCDVEG